MNSRWKEEWRRLFLRRLPEPRPECPDILTLYHSATGKLSLSEQRELEQHMEICLHCTEMELEIRKLIYFEASGKPYRVDERTGRLIRIPVWAVWFQSLRELSIRTLLQRAADPRNLRLVAASVLAVLLLFMLWVQARPVLARSPEVLALAREVPMVKWILPASARQYLEAMLLWDTLDQIPTDQQEQWERLARRVEGHLIRATELDPGYAEAYFWLGELYATFYYRDPEALGAGRFLDMARDAYSRVLQLNPSHIKAHFGLADIYSTLGQFDRELEEYDAILRLDPLDVDARWARGWVFLEQKEFDRAMEDFQVVLRQDPRDWETLWAIGLSQIFAGKFDLAEDTAQKLERLNPGRAELLRQILKVFRTRSGR